MHSLNRSGWRRRSALAALLLGALPFPVVAQIRRPEPAPSGEVRSSKPKHRTDLLLGGGTIGLNQFNATEARMFVGSVGVRRQFSPKWLSLGAVVDFGSTSIDGDFFPYEKRPLGDTTQFLSVSGSATMIAGRLTADAMVPLGDSERFRFGGGVNVGMYTMRPTPAAGANAGAFVAPTFGAAVLGEADLTARIGAYASLGFTQFTGFDREKLRPSDPALEDVVFRTPFVEAPPSVKSFGSMRLIAGLRYRFGITKTRRGAK